MASKNVDYVSLSRISLNRDSAGSPEKDPLWRDVNLQDGESNAVTCSSLQHWRLIVLTSPFFGLQAISLLLLSYGNPFLHSLEISKPVTALVWMSEPLCRVVFQPLLIAVSSSNPWTWGYRKPFVLCGTFAAIFFVLALTCTEDLTKDFIGVGQVHGEYVVRTMAKSHYLTQLLAILWIIAMNISIQPLLFGMRTFLIEQCPRHQLAEALAWSTTWGMLGGPFIGLAGSLDVTKWSTWLEKANLKPLGLITALSLAIPVVAAYCYFQDKNHSQKSPSGFRYTILSHITGIWSSEDRAPHTCRQVYKIQFVAFLAWFPVLYYLSSYVYETGKCTVLHDHVDFENYAIEQSDYRLIEKARDSGSFAIFLFSLVSLVVTFALHLLTFQSLSLVDSQNSSVLPTILGISLARVWGLSHALLAVCCFLTFFVWTTPFATGLLAITGICWAINSWIPILILKSEITQNAEDSACDNSDGRVQHSRSESLLDWHHLAISMPQILSALVCAILFKLFDVVDVRNGEAWIFRLSGIASCFALYLTKRLEL
ncbi:hypothetical protein BKA64DRAFT_564822 [Cadophora sp. MPI-SDFR-AT-0126]|nr:hypothetical protein BKA64DRAFT_564822 [Leotiomycetes sp. MPI-SDFR-AT-0126]